MSLWNPRTWSLFLQGINFFTSIFFYGICQEIVSFRVCSLSLQTFEDIVTCRVVCTDRALLNLHQFHRYYMTSSFLNQKKSFLIFLQGTVPFCKSNMKSQYWFANKLNFLIVFICFVYNILFTHWI